MSDNVPIILIGGVPGVGKTSISGYIARSLGINLVFSGDYIREVIRGFVDQGNILNTSVYDSWKFFGENSEENVIRGFNSQGEMVNKATRRIINRAIDNGEPAIIETLYFIPAQLEGLMEKIKSIYIYIEDETLHVSRLNEREKYTHFGSPGVRLSSNIKNYRIIMRKSLEDARKFGIFTVDNSVYEKTRDRILQFCRES
ncbi:MAG: AAA family ATPase [Candidatus Thermoplasmatota archaeon]|jgi:mevalonate-3-phosphate-5-kinase|nr:AAA family ATPase [Candidatus Thermoplasmatota archaeon]MCL5790533.1 AAA family ATPase [Candidatus Thermoplasmatota archaeon]